MIEIKQVTGLDEREREGYDRTRETLRETELGGERVSLHLGFSRSFLPFSSFPPPPRSPEYAGSIFQIEPRPEFRTRCSRTAGDTINGSSGTEG